MADELQLTTSLVHLRPVYPSDIDSLFRLEGDPSISLRWRFAGEHPSPARYADSLWTDIVFSFVAVDPSTGHYRGLVTTYGYDPRNAHMSFAQVMFRDGEEGSPLKAASQSIDVASLAIEYAFRGWPIRKIYIEATEPNFAQFSSMVGRVGQEEGRFRGHVFQGGTWVDLITAAIYRDDWLSGDLSRRIVQRSGRHDVGP
ncbi:MAG: GNAT family protein [Actinobacteria bacterium]|nr:GNAT family protein [Actinomycetota bacterium]